MNFELWGATALPSIDLPTRPIGIIVLILLAGVYGWLLWRSRSGFLQTRSRILTPLLFLVALLFSQLILVYLQTENVLPPIGETAPPQRIVHTLAAIPVLAAALLLPAGMASLVGFASGLGRALWQTGHIYDPFFFAFVAFGLALLVRQQYKGQWFLFFRQSWFTIPIVYVLTLPISLAISTFLSTPPGKNLFAADLAYSTFIANLTPMIVEAAAASLIIYILAIGLPELAPSTETAEEEPPFSRSIKSKLISRFVTYSALLIVLTLTVLVYFSIRMARDLILDQMVMTSNDVSDELEDFIEIRQNLLARAAEDERLNNGNPAEYGDALEQWFRTGPFFRDLQLIEVSGNGLPQIVASYPADSAPTQLSEIEQLTISVVLISDGFSIGDAEPILGEQRFSIPMVYPLDRPSESTQRVLVGRIDDSFLAALQNELNSDTLNSSGYIVNASDQILTHANPVRVGETWFEPSTENDRYVYRQTVPENPIDGYTGIAAQTIGSEDNTRQLIYWVSQPGLDWRTVMVVPYDNVLSRAVDLSGILGLIIIIATAGFVLVLIAMSNTITQPLSQLVNVAENITAGNELTPLPANQLGYEEVDVLEEAFVTMQRALSRRLSELKLLLSVSQNVSASAVKRLSEGVQPILRGAIRGTGASGARIMIANPTGGRPLQYGVGAHGDEMAPFDRIMWRKAQAQPEVILSNEAEIRELFGMSDTEVLPFQTAVAMAINSKRTFIGVMWVGYRQAARFDSGDLNLLRTLTNQAVILSNNAHLYSKAQRQQERLNSVLDSTRNAVIVTDATDRVQLINPAMCAALKIKSDEDIRNRKVNEVLQPPELGELLVAKNGSADTVHTAELKLPNDRYYSISTATIHTSGTQYQGRVAVLNDITSFKETEAAKTNFVNMVSHDLRSPLTVMNGFVNMLGMVGDLNDKQREYVDRIRSGITRMTSLINNLLNVGRLESGIQLDLKPTQLNDLIKHLIHEVQPRADEKNILVVQKSTGTIPEVQLDTDLVRQSIENLINNAVIHARGANKITVGVTRSFEELIVSVQDNGNGIPLEKQDRLYDKFTRGDRDQANHTGSGLGLSIVKLIAESHHGRTWFKSFPEQGTTFYIAFPMDLDQKLAQIEEPLL